MTEPRRPKGRSPLYPSIPLETAVQRARQLYEKDRQHATPVATIASRWNYKSLNGPAAQTIAALKKYGLMDYEGAGEQRKAKLSALAVTILGHPDQAERSAGIREAALRPAVHRELWEKYQENLPPDDTLRWELIHDRGFTETGANEFIRVYRTTIAYAQLSAHDDHDHEQEQDADGQDDGRGHGGGAEKGENDPDPKGSRLSKTEPKRYALPLIEGEVVIEGQFPISERDWNQFMAVLAVMKPGLVAVNSEPHAEAE